MDGWVCEHEIFSKTGGKGFSPTFFPPLSSCQVTLTQTALGGLVGSLAMGSDRRGVRFSITTGAKRGGNFYIILVFFCFWVMFSKYVGF